VTFSTGYKAKSDATTIGTISDFYTNSAGLQMTQWKTTFKKNSCNLCGECKIYWKVDSGSESNRNSSSNYWNGDDVDVWENSLTQTIADRGLKIGSHTVYVRFAAKGDRYENWRCDNDAVPYPTSDYYSISFTIPAPSNVYVTGTAKSGWGTWTAMTSQGSNKWSIGVSAGAFKISHKSGYDGTWWGPYSVDNTKCVGGSISKSNGDNNATITVNQGYQNPVLWVDVANQKFWVVATASCTNPVMAQPITYTEASTSVTMKVKATSLGSCSISKWGLKAWTSSACSGDASFTKEIDNATTALTTTGQSVKITGLTANTTYYFKSYVQLEDETTIVSSLYKQRSTRLAAPSVNNATAISSTAATISGSTKSNGGVVTTLNEGAGFIYSTVEADITTPNVSEGHATFVSSGNVTSVGSDFNYTFSGLSANTTYYYRSRIIYSTNGSDVTSYSSTTKNFTTKNVFTSASVDDEVICIGTTKTLTKSSTPSDGASWAFSSGNTNVATVNPTTGEVTGVATGEVTITAVVSKSGYDDYETSCTVTVNAPPTAGTISGSSNVCSGATFTLTLDGYTSSGTTIRWQKSTNGGSTWSDVTNGTPTGTTGANTASLTTSQTNATQYRAVVTLTAGGCSSNTTAKTVSMYANSSVSSVNLSSNSVCIGQSGITASATKTLGKGNGAWSSSNTTVATVTSGGAITAKAAGSADIIYTITGGCNGTVSDNATLTVNPNMSVAGVSVSLDSDDVCLGATPTASKSGSEVLSGGTAQFISSDPTVATVNATTGAISTLKAGTTDITYRVSGGCGSTVETLPAELTVKAKPTLTITPAGTIYNYMPMTVSSDMDVATWSWTGSASLIDGYFTSELTRTATFKGKIKNQETTRAVTFTATGTNGCNGTVVQDITKDTESCTQ
jgi:hypothetical protein